MTGKKGRSGRPPSARTLLTNRFIEDVLTDFELFGDRVIEQVRKSEPETYLKIVASVMPKDVQVDVNTRFTLVDAISALESQEPPKRIEGTVIEGESKQVETP